MFPTEMATKILAGDFIFVVHKKPETGYGQRCSCCCEVLPYSDEHYDGNESFAKFLAGNDAAGYNGWYICFEHWCEVMCEVGRIKEAGG